MTVDEKYYILMHHNSNNTYFLGLNQITQLSDTVEFIDDAYVFDTVGLATTFFNNYVAGETMPTEDPWTYEIVKRYKAVS